MGAALGLAVLYVAVLALGSRANRGIKVAGALALRALLLLFPPAARDALSLLNCNAASVSLDGCSSLNGCISGSGRGRGSNVAVNVLASNPFYVCWAPGAAHFAAGALSSAALVCVVVVFPAASFYAVWQQSRVKEARRKVGSSPFDTNDRGGVDSDRASTVIINPMRQENMQFADGPETIQTTTQELPPLLAPFLSDFRPEAWYTRHADLALTLLLAALQVRNARYRHCSCALHRCPVCVCVQAILPTPSSKTALVGKAAAIIVSTLTLAVHAICVRPYASVHAWKARVRAALLVLAAACAAVVAWARALDLRLLSGQRAAASLTVGSYCTAVLFCFVLAVLVGGVALTMLRGLRVEKATGTGSPRMRSMLASPVHVRARHTTGNTMTEAMDVAQNAPHIVIGGDTSLAEPIVDITFAVQPVRRPQHVSSRRRKKLKRPALLDDDLSAAAVMLADPTATSADVAGACEGVMAALSRQPSAEAHAASATILPGLSVHLEAIVGKEDVSTSSSALVSVCDAMAALSDHADAALLSQLVDSGVPDLLVKLLRQSAPCGWTTSVPPSPTLPRALWLLGNMAADERAAIAFTRGGGARLLMELLACCVQTSAPRARQWADMLLHICVALASISAHTEAALSLLDSGVLHQLALVVHPLQNAFSRAEAPVSALSTGRLNSSSLEGGRSLADAEAAYRAIANIIRPCVPHASAAALVCRELAASDGALIAGCTENLWRSAKSEAAHALLEPDSVAALAAEVILCVVRCASLMRSSYAGPTPSDSGTGAADAGAVGTARAPDTIVKALVAQATASATLDAAQALLDAFGNVCSPRSAPRRNSIQPPDAADFMLTLRALSEELRCLM